MKILEDVVSYLKEKIESTNANNEKANTGARLLKVRGNPEDLRDQVSKIFETISHFILTDSTTNPAGSAKLTNVSFKIGEEINRYLKIEPIQWLDQVRIGDLFIEGFYNCKYLDIHYERRRNSSYLISSTRKMNELLHFDQMLERIRLDYTSQVRPENISRMMQREGSLKHPVIKGKKDYDPIDTDSLYVRSINKLQQTSWRINRRVFNAILSDPPSDVPILDNDAKEEKRKSKVLEHKFITAKAERMKDWDVFYQYMDADYRGRLYYKEPFLNYQGTDKARGMMKFAQGKPLVKENLKWLAIHTSCSFNMSYGINEIPEWCEADYYAYLQKEGLDNISVDKMTLRDREEWTYQYMQEILDAGKDGHLSNEAEKRYSFLACCIEWYDYNEAHSRGQLYMSHLPIPIDGSNNGWQHLGAISKDTHTGSLVGLVPVEIQKDFYVQTAKELKNLCKDDRLKKILHDMPMKKIRKGISKRGSMTRAYSAGAKKIAENMYFDCKAEDYHITYGITVDDCTKFAKLLIKAINNVCTGPLRTMEYLQQLAMYELGTYDRVEEDGETPADRSKIKRISEIYKLPKEERTDEILEELSELVKYRDTLEPILVRGNGKDRITWTTPSGFPVVYTKFRQATKKGVSTIAGYNNGSANRPSQIGHSANVPTRFPEVRGFICGISPNIIHSLDASHMAMVIDRWNGEFGAVHDSFSAHACDIDKLVKLTKETFIEMYDTPSFYNYLENEIVSDKRYLDVPRPDLGDLEVKEVTDSDYFFA